jgi:hypothetical protein
MLNGSTYIVRPCHAAVEKPLQRFAHLERIDPVVGRARGFPRQRADEGAIFHSRDVACVAPRQEATGPELRVELGEGACGDHLGAQCVVLACEPSTQ